MTQHQNDEGGKKVGKTAVGREKENRANKLREKKITRASFKVGQTPDFFSSLSWDPLPQKKKRRSLEGGGGREKVNFHSRIV